MISGCRYHNEDVEPRGKSELRFKKTQQAKCKQSLRSVLRVKKHIGQNWQFSNTKAQFHDSAFPKCLQKQGIPRLRQAYFTGQKGMFACMRANSTFKCLSHYTASVRIVVTSCRVSSYYQTFSTIPARNLISGNDFLICENSLVYRTKVPFS